MKNQPTEVESQVVSQWWLVVAAGIGCGGMVCAAILCCGVFGMIGAFTGSARQPNVEAQSSERNDSTYEFKPKAAPTVDTTLVMKLCAGMNRDQAQAILGRPHEEDRRSIPAIAALDEPAKVHLTWTYNPDSDGFIVLLFEDDILCDGGTGGYNINTGLVVP